MHRGLSTALIIPVLDEEQTIGSVLDGIDRSLIDSLIVVDNGSTDRSADLAVAHGAHVFKEPRRGYGSACLRGLSECRGSDLILFMNGDGSDAPEEIPRLLDAFLKRGADLVIGSRVRRKREPGALTPAQRFGNALTCVLLRLFWKQRATDLGPFRAIRRAALDRLGMIDPDFAWTIEMQVKAAQLGLRTVEVPVSCRNRRGGRSKVSGTVRGSWLAGKGILSYVFAAKFAEIKGALRREQPKRQSRERLILFTRFPESGRTKTRLIPALGAKGAVALHDRLAKHALGQARRLAELRGAEFSVHHAGGSASAMRIWLGEGIAYEPQRGDDLGARMAEAFRDAFSGGAERVVIMGSDCPDLSAEILSRAFDTLETDPVVFGPAFDGGYTLIGLRHPCPELFSGIEWGGRTVLMDTIRKAWQNDLQVTLLDPLRDIDRPEDLEHAAAFLPERAAGHAAGK
jgi:rSAM/selenodomain-associated transferase 1